MKSDILIITASLFGLTSVIFGAFGAHALKKILNKDQLNSFETGVRYQMYHAIVLLAIGFSDNKIESYIYWCFTLGIILFSFSIYGLVISDSKGKKLKILGPITPIGGLLLASAWAMLLFKFLN